MKGNLIEERKNNSVKAIMDEEETVQQKQIGKMIKTFDKDQWQANAKNIILPGILSKFEQCKTSRDMLIKTEQRAIVEANPHDTFFGAGITMHSPSIWLPGTYKGKNIMGKMLQVVREKIIQK